MRIRLTLDIIRHRDAEPEGMPEIFDASGGSAERAGRQPLGFAITNPHPDPAPEPEDQR